MKENLWSDSIFPIRLKCTLLKCVLLNGMLQNHSRVMCVMLVRRQQSSQHSYIFLTFHIRSHMHFPYVYLYSFKPYAKKGPFPKELQLNFKFDLAQMFHHNDEMFRRKKALTESSKRFSRMWLETNVWWNQKAHVCENQSELDSFHKYSDCKNIPHIYYLLRAMIMLMNACDSFSVPSWFIRQQWLATSQFVVMQLSTEAFATCAFQIFVLITNRLNFYDRVRNGVA